MTVPTLNSPKAVIRRWGLDVVIECQCEAKSILLLHDGVAVVCSCGLHHQFVSFNIDGVTVLPAEVGWNMMSWVPQTENTKGQN